MVKSFVGAVRRTRDVGNFRFLETEYEAKARIDWHAHRHLYFYIVLDGDFREQLRHGSAEYHPGVVTLRAPGEPHATVIGRNGARCLMVEVSAGAIGSHRPIAMPANGTVDSRSPNVAMCGARLLQEFYSDDTASALGAEGCALEMLAQLNREMQGSKGGPRWLSRIERHLRAHPDASPDAVELAAMAGVHPSHLMRSFRQRYGCTIGEFVRSLRITDAERALRSTTQPVGVIAQSVGFCDQSHFTREFRRRIGLTPAAYRRLHRSTNRLSS